MTERERILDDMAEQIQLALDIDSVDAYDAAEAALSVIERPGGANTQPTLFCNCDNTGYDTKHAETCPLVVG